MTLIVSMLLASLIPLAGPARADEGFVDTKASPHESAIRYIADLGVTQGCNPPANDRFCPDRRLTRAEMAAFLTRAFDLRSSQKDYFRDDETSQFQADINAVAAAGVTMGCNPPANDKFCPDGNVTRGEMAAFLSRVLGLPATDDFFSDDHGSVFERDINAVARVGITKGCNPPSNDRYCADRPVTRAEMATFLLRSIEIDRTGTTTTTRPDVSPPTSPPPGRCEGVPLTGPSNPKGDVVIKPGQSIQQAVDSNPNGTVFVIAAGVHRNQTVSPNYRNQFIGQPGAILDGGGTTEYAFGGPGNEVLIEGLEIRNYNSKLGQGTLRSVNSSRRWTIRANEIHSNKGQGIRAAGGWKVIGNHIHHNEQYGIGGLGKGLLIERNEISHNNPDGSVSRSRGAGGTKFIRTEGLVVRGNCSHHNQGPGLWTDGHNIDTLYEGNTVYDNEHAGIKHEVSCRATIRNNTATGNGFGNPNWLAGAGIVVLNSPDVTVTGNRVSGNDDGIAGIQGKRDVVNGVKCELLLKNLTVSNNVIEMSTGYSGIVTNESDVVFRTWGNEFTGNAYVLQPSGGQFFMWEGKRLTYQQWKALGHD